MSNDRTAKMYFRKDGNNQHGRGASKKRVDCPQCGGRHFYEDINDSRWYTYLCPVCHHVLLFMTALEVQDVDTGFARN